MMDRNEKILKHINKNGRGVEVGPSHSPVASKQQGYKVDIIDHLNQKDLIDKYKKWDINTNDIEEVDFVWGGESYSELTGKSEYYDWIIASHLVEHTPDLISFLISCADILKDDGVLSLVVPDKRYCFDHFRPITGLSKIIDNYLQEHKIHSPGTVAEFYLNFVKKDGDISWSSNTAGKYEFIHTFDETLQHMEVVRDKKTYIDLHAWCFTPHFFRLIIHDLFNLGFIPFQEVDFFQR